MEKSEQIWEFYFTNLEGKPASFYVDLGLYHIAPIAGQSNVMWISVLMNQPREDGLSSSEESEKLFALEDKLVGSLIGHLNITYAGRITSDNKRDFYFYVATNALIEKIISEAMASFPEYDYDYGINEDKEWIGYKDFLYPDPEQYQIIQNRRVVIQLEKGGDNLTKPREVDHWIYFNNASDKNNFLEKVSAEGYQIVSDDYDPLTRNYSYRLHIKRMDKVDLNSVNEYVLQLCQFANECNGDYDGWETSIESEQQ